MTIVTEREAEPIPIDCKLSEILLQCVVYSIRQTGKMIRANGKVIPHNSQVPLRTYGSQMDFKTSWIAYYYFE